MKMVEKRRMGVLVAVLAVGLCEPQMGAAHPPRGMSVGLPAGGVVAPSLYVRQLGLPQPAPQNNQVYGMFGSRTLGQSLVPSASTFGGGIQTNPDGSFRGIGTPAVGTPTVPAVVNAAPSPQSPAPASGPPEFPLFPETSETEDMGQAGAAEQALGAGPPPAAVARETRFGSRAPAAVVHGPLPYARSTELSDRLTRFARAKGILSARGIDVYLSGTSARLEGTVGTPRDRDLLATILGLEPAVRQIDNRLVVEGAGTIPPPPAPLQ